MSCPSRAELLALAFAAPRPHDRVRGHAGECAECAAEVQRWRDIATFLQLAGSTEPAAGPCLDEMTIAAVAVGSWAAVDPAAMAHLTECADCRSQLADAIEAVNAPEIAAEIARVQTVVRPRRRRLPPWTRVAAVAATLAGVAVASQLFLSLDGPADRTRELRDGDPTITKTEAPRIIAPAGMVDRVTAFVWTGVPGAMRYGMRLFDGNGTVLWHTETRDTTAALPSAIELRPGTAYFYKVEAYTSFDRFAESELMEFRVHP